MEGAAVDSVLASGLWVIVGTVLGVALPVLLLRWRRAAAAGDHPDSRPARPQLRDKPAAALTKSGKRSGSHRFHGVSIKPGAHACAAAGTLVDQRFLPEDAPPLPLGTCDQAKCRCAYTHYDDRRDQENRRTGWGTFGGFTQAVPGGNRRNKGKERRS